MQKKIFCVEDNLDDVMLISLACRKAGVTTAIEVANDGDRAVSTLAAMADDGVPGCILLDIQLPGMSGLDVLAWIRLQDRLKRLPVIMLTSSFLPSDIRRAYQLGANSYLAKPSDLASLVSLVTIIERYWIRSNVQPPVPMRVEAACNPAR